MVLQTMEKKKLLLVTISVGVFLVIAIGASIIVFSPRNPVPAVTAAAMQDRPIPAGIPGTLAPSDAPEDPLNPGIAGTPGIAGSPVPTPEGSPAGTDQSLVQVQPATADPAEMVRNSGNYQALQTPPGSSAQGQENRFYITGDNTQPAVIERQDEESSSRVVINVQRPQTAAVPNESPAPPSARKTGTTAGSSNSKPAGTSAAQRVAVAPAKTTTPAAKTAPAAKTTTPAKAATPAAKTVAPAASQSQSRGYDAYWVQTGSFPTRNQADKAKEILASKGLTAIIENGDVKGETWYRVRIGPYTSQNEADYWLSLVKSINGTPYIDLASSIIWKSYTRP